MQHSEAVGGQNNLLPPPCYLLPGLKRFFDRAAYGQMKAQIVDEDEARELEQIRKSVPLEKKESGDGE